jgi:phosphatidylinositol alpha 1,6-mannosyltransferase
MRPRVAYFPDSFHEVNGVAHTSRNFVAYAERHDLPFLCVRAGTRPNAIEQHGKMRTLELPRSEIAVGMEKDLAFDPLFWRHADTIEDELHRFRPDILHMTGPSELGIFAAYFAWKLQIPLAASWHTNVHEYAAKRIGWLTSLMPTDDMVHATEHGVEAGSWEMSMFFYSLAKVLFAPNTELCDMLAKGTGRPCHLMQRGVDTALFSPAHRTRPERKPEDTSTPFVLGYVGRLSIEKNVSLLPVIERELAAAGLSVHFLIVGHGVDEEALRRELPNAEFKGVQRGLDLSQSYANMDLLVFPSHTDTFGNVVLEALASGVPSIVTPDGGPKYIVRERDSGEPETGVITGDSGFATAIAEILRDPARLAAMRSAARAYALNCSWDAVFDRVYAAYEPVLAAAAEAQREEWRSGEGAFSSPG